MDCPERVTGETKTFTSQCKLSKGHDDIRNYDAYIVDFSASIFDTVCFYKDSFFFISLCYFNQFDTTSKVMYRHEIICAGNTVRFNYKLLFANDDVTMQWLPISGKYRDVWIAAIASSRTSLATLTGVVCNASQCELRSLR